MTSRRVLTFQTPKKKVNTLKKTEKRKKQQISDETNTVSSDITELSEKIETRYTGKEDETIENKLIEAYRKENQFLRKLKKESLVYLEMLGIGIEELENGTKRFSIQRESSIGLRKIVFRIEETESTNIFTLEDAVNCTIPEYFNDIIEFDKKAFSIVFYKAMQSVYESQSGNES